MLLNERIYKYCRLKSLLVFLIMLIVSVIYVLPYLHRGVIPYGDDIAFNVNRIRELANNLQHGNWYPYMYVSQFGNVPDPLGIFYPQLTTLPFAFFTIIFKNIVIGICSGIAFFTFLTMLGAYWVARQLNRGRLAAIISAVAYTFSTYRAVAIVTRFDISEFITMTFIPITLYGLYKVMKKQSGIILLGLGLSMILLSHVLSAFLCSIFLAVEFIVLAVHEERWRTTLVALLKSVGLFVASSIIWLGPFLEQEVFQKYSGPWLYNMQENSSGLSTILINSVNNNLLFSNTDRATIGVALVVTVVWGIFHFSNLDNVAKYSLLVGIVTIVVSSSLFPWGILMHTPLKLIQFSFRLLTFSTVFLSLIVGDMCTSIISEREIVKATIAIGIVLSLWYSGVSAYRNKMAVSSSQNLTIKTSYDQGKYQIDGAWHLTDYGPKSITPEEWRNIYTHNAVVDGHKIKIRTIIDRSNGVEYADRRLQGERVTLPVMLYKNIQIKQEGRRLKPIGKGMVHIKNVTAAPIQYQYAPSPLDIGSKWVSLITWTWVVLYGLIHYLRMANKSRVALR